VPWKLTSPFNAPRDYSKFGGKKNDKHEGVDVAPTGGMIAHVLAVADGVVTKVTTSEGYGNYCIVQSSYGGKTYWTWRAHMDFVSVAQGQQVKKGQTLGICGDTGNATGRHDHLTMTTNPPWGMSGYILPGVVDPTPFYPKATSGTTYDLLPYLKGDGTIYQTEVHWQGQQHGQQMQTQTDNSGNWYQVKNSEWEQMRHDVSHIYRGIDTSPGNGMYYAQFVSPGVLFARWCPRHWAVGGLYERNPLVTFYWKDTGAQVQLPGYQSGYRRTWLKFVAHYPTWKSPYGGLTFTDVVELHWLLQPTSQNAERYFYARGFGLVGWSSWNGDYSYVVEIFSPGEREPADREKIAITF
jgi:hypothetical protein